MSIMSFYIPTLRQNKGFLGSREFAEDIFSLSKRLKLFMKPFDRKVSEEFGREIEQNDLGRYLETGKFSLLAPPAQARKGQKEKQEKVGKGRARGAGHVRPLGPGLTWPGGVATSPSAGRRRCGGRGGGLARAGSEAELPVPPGGGHLGIYISEGTFDNGCGAWKLETGALSSPFSFCFCTTGRSAGTPGVASCFQDV